jgi:hypothetical protein
MRSRLRSARVAVLWTLTVTLLLGGCGGDDGPARESEKPNLPAPVASDRQPSGDDDVKAVADDRALAELRALLGPEADRRLVVEDGRLVAADLSGTGIDDLSLLKGQPLRELYLEGTPVADISPLAGMPLEKLWLKNTQVTDLAPLAGMALDQLSLFGTPIKEIALPADTTVGTLWLVDTKVKDLSPLQGRSLASLDVQGTPVSDLAPLADMPSLRRLNIIGTQVTDLSPLSRLAQDRLLLTPKTIETGWDAIRQMASLQTIDTVPLESNQPMSAAEFWQKFDAGAFRE